MSITLTPRFISVLSRYFEIYREEIIKDGLQFADNDQYIRWFKFGTTNLKVAFKSEKNKHHYLCSNDDGDIITAEEIYCEECRAIHGITIILSLVNYNTDVNAESITFTKDTTLEEMLEKIEKLSGKVYDFCGCDSVAFKDGLCKNCYIHSYTRTEEEGGDCSICYENGGRWCKFEQCKHQFHTVCVGKMDKKICPLCRGTGNIKMDPFDV